jgi:hypothetical protein
MFLCPSAKKWFQLTHLLSGATLSEVILKTSWEKQSVPTQLGKGYRL